MQISIETTGTLGRRLHVVVPSDQLEKAVDRDLQHYAHTAKLDGFRPGKAPMRIIKQYFGDRARAKAIDEVLQKSLREAINQEKLNFVERSLAIESLEATPGQPMKYIATFEIYPEVALKDFSSINLEKLIVKITDEDIEQVLAKIQKQHALWQEVSRAAQWGDRITFDLFVKIAGDEQPKKQQENTALILEKDQLPAGFEALNGAKVGDEIRIKTPAEGSNSTPTAELSVKINTVSEPQLPELNAEFAEKLGVEERTMEGLRAQVRNHMEKELETILKNKLKMQLLDKLLEIYPLELPKLLIEAETEHIQKEIRERVARELQQKEVIELPEMAQQQATETAKRRVTLSLLFSEIVKRDQLKVSEERVRAHVERIAMAFEDPEATLKLLYSYKEVMRNIRLQAMEEQVIEKILEQVQLHEKEVSYSEVMQFQPQASHVIEHGHSHEHTHECHHSHDEAV